VGPRAGLNEVEKRKFLILPELEILSLGRPVRSRSLHRLRYHVKMYSFCKSALFWARLLESEDGVRRNVFTYYRRIICKKTVRE
jgi:hypothetical protein